MFQRDAQTLLSIATVGSDGNTLDYVLSDTSLAFASMRGRTSATYDPPLIQFQYPVENWDQTVNYISGGFSITYRRRATILRKETITVAAGTFETWKISYYDGYVSRGQYWTTTEWWHEVYGVIKTETDGYLSTLKSVYIPLPSLSPELSIPPESSLASNSMITSPVPIVSSSVSSLTSSYSGTPDQSDIESVISSATSFRKLSLDQIIIMITVLFLFYLVES